MQKPCDGQAQMRRSDGWRSSYGQGSGSQRKGESSRYGFLRTLASNAVREVAEHPARTLITALAGLAVSHLTLRRKAAPGDYVAEKADKARGIASAGLLAAMCVLLLGACGLMPKEVVDVKPDPASFGSVYPNTLAEAGEQLAREHCVECHSVHWELRSGKPPPLNRLLSRRSSEELADYLFAGLPMDHGGMPVFEFNSVATISLVAYLESLTFPGSAPSVRAD